jgi:hypothetical protein
MPVTARVVSYFCVCNIWGFHGCDYEECRLLGCGAICLVKTGVSETRAVSVFKVERISELGTTLAVPSRQKAVQTVECVTRHRRLVGSCVPSAHTSSLVSQLESVDKRRVLDCQ